jgi:hypothetical protein
VANVVPPPNICENDDLPEKQRKKKISFKTVRLYTGMNLLGDAKNMKHFCLFMVASDRFNLYKTCNWRPRYLHKAIIWSIKLLKNIVFI